MNKFRDFDYAVEFRHRSWLDEGKKMDAATLEALKEGL